MYSLLLDIFWLVILLDLFALVVVVVFFINARINLQRQIINQRFFVKAVKAAKTAESSIAAAEMLNIDSDEFAKYCKRKSIDIPEVRTEKKERVEKIKREEEQKILQEEAKWRAEQEILLEERSKEQEESARKRKENLKKFGFK